MTLKNSRSEWIYENKTWTIPKENGEGYVSELEDNSLVLGLMNGKSARMNLHIFILFTAFFDILLFLIS